MVSSIDSSILSYLQSSTSSSTSSTSASDDLFSQLSTAVGGDGKTITKEEVENTISKLESEPSGSSDTKELNFLKKLDKNWDKISGGNDSITSSQLAAGKSYLEPHHHHHKSDSATSSDSSTSLYSSLADATGASSSGITKDDLTSYLKSLVNNLSSDSSNSTSTSSSTSSTTTTDSTTNTKDVEKEVGLVINLIANFDSLSNGQGYITSSSLQSGLSEPQDPSTVTQEQLQSPIDLKV